MGTTYSIFVSTVALSLAFLMKNHIENIAGRAECFRSLELSHARFCADQDSKARASENVCLGWALDSRELASGCYFKLSRL